MALTRCSSTTFRRVSPCKVAKGYEEPKLNCEAVRFVRHGYAIEDHRIA